MTGCAVASRVPGSAFGKGRFRWRNRGSARGACRPPSRAGTVLTGTRGGSGPRGAYSSGWPTRPLLPPPCPPTLPMLCPPRPPLHARFTRSSALCASPVFLFAGRRAHHRMYLGAAADQLARARVAERRLEMASRAQPSSAARSRRVPEVTRHCCGPSAPGVQTSARADRKNSPRVQSRPYSRISSASPPTPAPDRPEQSARVASRDQSPPVRVARTLCAARNAPEPARPVTDTTPQLPQPQPCSAAGRSLLPHRAGPARVRPSSHLPHALVPAASRRRAVSGRRRAVPCAIPSRAAYHRLHRAAAPRPRRGRWSTARFHAWRAWS